MKRRTATFGAMLVALLLSTGCGSSEDDHRSSVESTLSGVELVRRVNGARKQAHELSCQVCACGEFLDVPPDVESCVGRVLDRFPEIKSGTECVLTVLERHLGCVEEATTCQQAESCDAVRDMEQPECPPTSSNAADEAATACAS
jgi:hypothetical protein